MGCGGSDRTPFAAAATDADASTTLARPMPTGNQRPPTRSPDASEAGNEGSKPDACQAIEICNGADDDCNGTVDEGCPSGISIGAPAGQVMLGGSTGGAAFSDACAANEILVGLEASAGAWMDHIRAICRPFSLAVDTSAIPYRYRLASAGTRRPLELHPPVDPVPTLTPLVCPDDQVMVALRVSQQTYQAFVVMPKMWVTCAALSIEMDGSGEPQAHWHDASQVGPLAGFYSGDDAGESFFASDAIQGSTVPVQIVGSAGSWIDRIGYGLAELSVATKQPSSRGVGHE